MKFLGPPQSGSQAGTTSSRNRFGQYTRSRAVPVNPNSVRQALVRNSLGTLASLWRSLDPEARSAWDALASMLPVTDSLGQTIYLTGFMTFIKFNQVRASLTLATLEYPPVISSVAPVPLFTIGLTDAPEMSITLATAVPADNAILVFASPPRSPGRNFENDYRFQGVIGATGTTLDVADTWELLFGPVASGQKVFFKLTPSTVQGQQGVSVVGSAVAVDS